MKKVLLIGLVVLGVTGCLDKANAMLEGKAGASKKKEVVEVPQFEVTTLVFKNDDINAIVDTTDNYETATIKYDGKNGLDGQAVLFRVVSASGVDLLSEDKKVELFMKGDEGIITIDGTDYNVKVAK